MYRFFSKHFSRLIHTRPPSYNPTAARNVKYFVLHRSGKFKFVYLNLYVAACGAHFTPPPCSSKTKLNKTKKLPQPRLVERWRWQCARHVTSRYRRCFVLVGSVLSISPPESAWLRKGRGEGGVNKGGIETEKKNEQGRTTLLSPSEKRMWQNGAGEGAEACLTSTCRRRSAYLSDFIHSYSDRAFPAGRTGLYLSSLAVTLSHYRAHCISLFVPGRHSRQHTDLRTIQLL